jgi:hypothetical protein
VNGQRRFVITYSDIPYYSARTALNTFQIQLHEGTDAIQIHYQSMPLSTVSVIVGVENQGGTLGTTYLAGVPTRGYFSEAIQFLNPSSSPSSSSSSSSSSAVPFQSSTGASQFSTASFTLPPHSSSSSTGSSSPPYYVASSANYDWLPPSNTLVSLSLSDDSISSFIAMPFSFRFYGLFFLFSFVPFFSIQPRPS